MYRVLINRNEGRILVTGKARDLKLLHEGWELLFESFDWDEAFEYAMKIAKDEVIEWYYDEEVKKKFVKGLSIAA
ncbi:hypothetical protein [Pyrobaculum aerophilum]|uniref:Conserved within P. aerophilum n=2 Tax=Pyrobaculum aerophilum TaxID=13773 RepID=Q8ZWG6_PYRAE|nr:hypothetical protein [Pyrobaculum aerophilum]AAL63736.1 conserved within P. aerophilum [Pyrobaculum aerophilum str. IM2]MCX8137551.1 hypothetical protein [Pyrobaculum aerophilum]HII46316.1 hypothetical protein [Pyrobaculum aerophilum]